MLKYVYAQCVRSCALLCACACVCRAVGSNFMVVRLFNMHSMLLLGGSGGMPPQKNFGNICSEIASKSMFFQLLLVYLVISYAI